MKLGVFISLTPTPEIEFKKVRDLGFPTCQLNGWVQSLFTNEIAKQVVEAAKKYGVEITSFWCGWEGPAVWDFIDGPVTLGLVPPAFRHDRLAMLKKGSDFAAKIGVRDLTTHVGFIPEDPNNSEYMNVVDTLRDLAQYCKSNRQNFLFETGQETPITLLRTIEDIGLDNLGINLDPANLILYGKANPVDSLDVYGKYVKGVHAKDGLYPTSGRYLGQEVPLGQGKVNIPAFIAKLKEVGYDGPLTIEREISGDEQTKDILAAKVLLEEYI
jgi:sugar phosphate isomerase/epimerase